MRGETRDPAASTETLRLLEQYHRERVAPHPVLAPFLADAAICVPGALAAGGWDERSDLEVRWALPDEEHARLAAALRQAALWDPARDFRLRLEDREPFRRFPGAVLLICSAAQLTQELRFDLPTALWAYRRAAVLQDPLGILESRVAAAEARFRDSLPALQCEHYYRFRQARSELAPKASPRRAATALAIRRGEAAREALRIAFLAEGQPYPDDPWLEPLAERESRAGAAIVTAVRALVAARDAETIEHASKVLRDRVVLALQQGGVTESWLEQWWLWPAIAPVAD